MLKVRLTVIKIALIVIGVIIMVTTFGDAMAVFKKDFGKIYEKGINDYEKGELVTGKIEYAFDAVAQLESTHTVYGVPVSKNKTPYYLCFVEHETDDLWGYYIIVHVTDKDSMSEMNKLRASTRAILNSPEGSIINSHEPVALKLKTIEIPSEVMDYTLEYMMSDGLTEKEAKSILAPYMLEEKDYNEAKILPLIGFIMVLIPVLMIIISRRKTAAYKSSRTHYVNESVSDPYDSAPVTNGNTQGTMRRYSADAYEAHTYPGGVPPQEQQSSSGRRYDPAAYSGGENYQTGEMDSIDTTNLDL